MENGACGCGETPIREKHFAALCALHAAPDAEALAGVLNKSVRALGVSYLQIIERVAGDQYKAVFDTAPRKISVSAVFERHPKVGRTVSEIIQAGLPFDLDTVDGDSVGAPYREVLDEHRRFGGMAYYYAVPTFFAGVCSGLAVFYFQRRPRGSECFQSDLCILGQGTFDGFRAFRPVPSVGECPLTPRQREALAYCGDGKSDWDIGVLLGVSQATAHEHVETAKRKLGVRTRIQAVLLAYKNRWIEI